KAFIAGVIRESAAGSAAASRIGRTKRFMGPHIHNVAIVAILSGTAEHGRQAMLSTRTRRRGRSCMQFYPTGALALSTNIGSFRAAGDATGRRQIRESANRQFEIPLLEASQSPTAHEATACRRATM